MVAPFLQEPNPPSSGGHLQTSATLTTAAAAPIAPDSTCGSEFSDSGSSSVSDDVVTSGRRQRQLVGVGGGHRGHEMATLVEKDDADEIGAWVYYTLMSRNQGQTYSLTDTNSSWGKKEIN